MASITCASSSQFSPYQRGKRCEQETHSSTILRRPVFIFNYPNIILVHINCKTVRLYSSTRLAKFFVILVKLISYKISSHYLMKNTSRMMKNAALHTVPGLMISISGIHQTWNMFWFAYLYWTNTMQQLGPSTLCKTIIKQRVAQTENILKPIYLSGLNNRNKTLSHKTKQIYRLQSASINKKN